MNNYNDVQISKKVDKVFMAVVCLENHALEYWTRKNAQKPKLVENLNWICFKTLLLVGSCRSTKYF